MRILAETDTTEAKTADDAARATADIAAGVGPNRKLRFAFLLFN